MALSQQREPDSTSVTIVVACRNENPHIRLLLDSLTLFDRTNLDLEVIIADGMSTDGTRRILEDFQKIHPWLEVVDNPSLIVSTGLNRAIVQARGEFIVRMDAHAGYEPEYVVHCIAVAKSTGAANVGGPQRSRARSYWQRAIRAGFHSRFASGGATFRNDDYLGPTDTVPYGCWRKDLLLRIGMFDETLVRNQDDELNLRIRKSGGIIWQDPSIVSWYSPRPSLSGLFRQYLQFGFWRIAVIRKHPGSASFRHYVPGAAALVAFGLTVTALAGLVLDERRVFESAFGAIVALACAYVVLSAVASVQAARKNGWDLLPALPVAFALYQAGYAAGFCAGLVYWGLCGRKGERVPRVFTVLSR